MWRLDVVVELEFVGVGAEPELVEFGGALVVQPGGDEVVGEYAAFGEEGVVGLQGVEDGVEGAGDLGDGGGLVGGQFVQVFVDRLGRFDLVLDPVQAGHEHRGEREVGVGGRVGDAELDPLGLGVGAGDRDPGAGRAVPLGVDQVDRGLEAGYQPVVGVRRRVGEGQQRGGVLEQPADVVAAGVGQARVADLVVEQRRAVLPQRLVAVHAVAVVAEQRLGHERDGLARGQGGRLDHVLVRHQLVGHRQQRAEPDVDLGLPGRADLVVLHLHLDAALDQHGHHLRAQVGVVVHRRHREVPALVPGLVGQVPAVLVLAGVPGAFHRVDVVVALVRRGREPRRIENVELRLRAEERRIPDPGAAQVILRLTGDVARVPGVRRPGQRIMHEEGQVQRLARAERVKVPGRRVRQQLHIRLVDLLEPPDRRPVEHQAVSEDPRPERRRRHREMLHRPRQVTKPDVDELHVLLRDETEDLLGTAKHQCPLSGVFAVLILGAALLEGFADARTGVRACVRGRARVAVRRARPGGCGLGRLPLAARDPGRGA